MKRAETVKADEVIERARKVASQVVRDRFGDIDIGEIKVGWYPGHGTMGLVIRGDLIGKLEPKQALEVADKITSELGDFAIEQSARVTFGRDFGTVGFFPRIPMEFGGLR